ncbi:non-ribosomal peptide synthase/polyketide synthase [Archangium violaceum]|uniref:non-ribosomal peptide synthase/polyketide synthase n=1 Tax=Archangium violaceum TaxID=83451 RepID=UPI00193C7520|nr:non-ribosomal peptide synthase/polyketide synthase [Archangium violaceum]QRK05610.1 non-ribosomal peptide synthase/polyketide synthase [Archangium violaceum]
MRKPVRRPPPMVPVSRDAPLPLSFAQQRLWFIDQLAPGGHTYNVPFFVRLKGSLDVAALQKSFTGLLRRHESLRTTFTLVNGQPVQRIAPEHGFVLPVESLGGVAEGEREEVLRRLAEEEARRAFDLEKGPVIRARLLRVTADDHVLLLSKHHIVSDMWSLTQLERDLSALYQAYVRGEEPALPALPVQYADYAMWQREWLKGEVLEAHLGWWKQQLAGAPPVLELPTDRPRPPVQSARGAARRVMLSPALSGAVKELSSKAAVTQFMTLLAGFHALLARYSGQADIVVGSPISGRNRREVEGLIGFFTNTLALRVDGSGDMSFRELLGQVRESCLGAYAHQELPFEQLVDALQPARDLSRSPLFQVFFVHQGSVPCAALELPGVSASELVVESGVSRFDLMLSVRETPEGWLCIWEYNTDLYEEATVERMAAHYVRLLEGAVAHPEQKLSALPLMSEEERRRVVVEFNDTGVLYAPARGVHELFEAWADRRPEAVAVSFGEERLTYGELNRKANRLAHHLRTWGVGPDVPVGLCVKRSLELAVGVLGILKAGGAYVPLDPAYPAERLALMLNASRAPVLLTQKMLEDSLPASEAKRLYLEADESTWAGCSEANPESVSGPEALAYVIYTSGSTGVPKGVAMHHRPLLNLMRWQVERSGAKRTLQFSALSFDVSFQELFSTWGAGGELVLIAEEMRLEARALLEKMESSGVERLYLPFVALQNLAEVADREGLAPSRLREVITAGEQLRVTPALRGWLGRMKGCVLENQYGPTETHVATAYRMEGEPEKWPELPSIGKPIANTSVHLLDGNGEPVPVGVPGELYIGGVAVARGYLHRPELTQEKFVPDVFGVRGERLYRTGDYARYLADGNIEFLGRRDAQVKVRGFRIELAEVEAALARHPSVKDVAVVAREVGAGGKQLVAYVVGKEGQAPGAGELKSFLKERLPEYMVPSAFVRLESFPLTPSGKVDRKSLPAPEMEATGTQYVAPRTVMEEVVAGVWAPLLSLGRVGAHDNFFELGGHSLLATQVASRLREVLQLDVPVRLLFESATVAELAQRLESAVGGGRGTRPPPLVPMPSDGELPLSFAQQRLWFIEQFAPGGFAYNLPFVTRLKGKLEVAALERSLTELMRRHEALRTTFAQVDGKPVQRVAAESALALPVESLEALPEGERARELQRRVEEEFRRAFDLEMGPLVRALLLRVTVEEHVLVLVMHHIIGDGWSLGVLVRELAELYEAFSSGAEPALAALPVQYADYALWQREWLKGEVLEAQLSWWKGRLAGAPTALELPTDRPRPAVQSFRGATLAVRLPAELSGVIRELNRREGVTPFMTFLAAYQALLARYSGQRDIVVGSPIAGRTQREMEGLIGFFVNTLALRVDATGEVGFRTLLRRVREACLGAYAHQDMPFEQLVNALHPVRDLSRPALFQVMFALQEPSPTLSLTGVSSEEVTFEAGLAKFELTLFVREGAEGWESQWEYNTDLFDEGTVARMAAHYVRLLESALASPERRIDELPLLTEEERRQLLVEWNQTRTEYPREASVHALFEEQVEHRPAAVAVEYEGKRLTYAELNGRANQVARALRRLGVTVGTRVGLCAGRSVELVVATLGILKAGGAYVPLDPTYPAERLSFMVEDTAVPVVLAQPELVSKLPPVSAKVVELTEASFASESGEDLGQRVAPEALAYVMYTSGSTGRPKGVCIPHRGIVRTVRNTNYVRFTERDRVTQMSNTAFDASTFELWGALLNGATLLGVPREVALSPKALAAFLREQQASVVFVTTALFNQVAAECPDAFRTAKYVLFGGEAADPRWVKEVLEKGAPEHLVNGYGPTEVTTFTCCYGMREPGQVGQVVPIGRPVSNTDVYVLDERMQPVPLGVVGELYAGGDGLALGYLDRPELTAEKFVAHPFSAEPEARLYRTGDLVRYRPDGSLEYLGRRDAQVKVRGFRIELGEVEAALAKHPGVGEVVVTAREDGPGGKRLVAYVVPREGQEVGAGALRALLKQTLPEHMVPSAFVVLEALPLTPNGKVDRKALPAPEAEGTAREGYVAPRTELELVVADIWAPLLKQRVGALDNFFELGGHSLLAAQVATRLREVLQRELPLRVLFEAPTVAELAARLESMPGGHQGRQLSPLVPVPREGGLPLSFAQQRLWFIEQLEPGGFTYNVPYAVRLKGRLDVSALERSLREIVRRHESLRTTFVQVDGRPVQRIAPEQVLTLPVESLEGLPSDAVRLRVEQEARRPFDLETGPVVRVVLLRAAADEHVLVLVMHHIACDVWSLDLMLRELETLYRALSSGEEPALPPLPVQYADYATWQREWLKGEVLEAQLSWWKQQLAEAPPVLELSTDRPRPAVQTFRGAYLSMPLPAALSEAVKKLSHEEGVTRFMAFLAAYQALLARYSGQTDIVVGSPISGRNRREVEGLIGFFLNTLALRVDASGDVGFRELLRRVRESCLGAYAHQDLPFEQLVDALQPMRDLSRSPLFQVMFVYQTALTVMALPGVSVDEFAFQPGMAKFDLTLFVRETPNGLVSVWEYNTDLYEEATVGRMAAHYVRLLEGAVAHPEQKLSALPLMSEEERRRVVVEFNDTGVLYAPARGVHELFEAWADRRPEAVAVSFGEERLTYGELNRKANRLAHHLRTWGVGPDVPVGLCVKRSLELAVGVLGILKAGGAYVPLDPAYPAERLALMLNASRAPVLLTQKMLEDSLPASEAKRLYLEADESAWAGCSEANPQPLAGPEALAYVIYTSGSTGVPKGVAMHHRPLLNLMRWQVERSGAKKTLQFSALSFDVSFQELFSTWGAGGELVLIAEEMRLEARALLEKMESSGVERLYLPFVALQNLAEVADREGLAPSRLREVITAGEQLRVTPALRGWLGRMKGCVLENQYGPTETHVATAYRMEGEPEKWPELPSIGKPIANTSVHLLDGNGEPVPVGVPGELYIGGVAVARGYLHRPELTQEKFVPDVFGVRGERLYRTGDYARYLADGNIEFLGRRDAQVKVRGFRIELAEVEAALAKHPSVKDVAVVAREVGAGGKQLVAYVVGKEGQAPGAGELKSFLKERLPEYMVPRFFVSLESFPLTPSGKVDRRALPAPDVEGMEREGFVAPRTEMEQRVADLWAPLLGQGRVGAHDNFFELGGHSLLAMQVTSRLREELRVELPVRVLFEAPTVAELAHRLESMPGGKQVSRPPPLVPVPRDGALPLSFAQQRLWFLDRFDPRSSLYNLALVLRLEGALDVGALERSFRALVHRHEALRTTFQQGEQGVFQVISSSVELPLAVVDLRELPEGNREEEARRLFNEEVLRPFDLKMGPLLRVTLLRLGEAEHVLVLAMHHIVSDGWSMGVLARELKALYEAFLAGKESPLEALPIQYADYAKWQREWLGGEVLSSRLSWWRQQLEGAPPTLELPTDRPRPPVLRYRGALHYLTLPMALAEGLRKLSQREGVTLFMTLLAGFHALLHRYSGQDDICVGSPIAGRNHAEVEGLIGFFVNVLVMRARVKGEAPFRELLHQVKETALGAYAHQEVPFEKLVEELKPARDTRRTPLFQVAFALQNTPSPELALPGIVSRSLSLAGQTSRFDLTLSLRETAAGLEGVVEYSTDLFEASTIDRMFGHLRTLLEGVVADPGRRVGELPLLTEEERRRVLVEWNQTRTEYPREASVHALFEEQVTLRPGAVAVEYEARRLTYSELNHRANQVARHLRRLGVTVGTPVGLCSARSLEMVVATLGILKAGGAYVPLDVSYPAERLAFMLEDTAVPVVLVPPELTSKLPPTKAKVVELSEETFAHERGENLEEPVGPESLAYVMYTSGSTGRPKGVCIPHRAIVRLVRNTRYLQVTEEDRFTLMSNTSFDAATLELWGALLNGAALVGVPREVVLSPRALAAFLREQRASHMFVTTALFNQVAAESPDAFRTMKYVVFGGESADPRWAREVLEKGAPEHLLNGYGPTENTTFSTTYEVREVPGDATSVSIGKPISNSEAYVLDAWMQPVPVGVPGELYVGGEGLALGYLNRPELTAEKFVAHPFSQEPGAKLYKTGDVAKYLPDGNLEYLGRRDAQVKVRGFRIELGEVEAALAKHPGVGEVVVTARDEELGGKRLVAYVVPRQEVAVGALRAFLKESLPEQMIPSAFVLLESLPLTPNGKVDRAALPVPEASGEARDTYVAPRTELEQVVADLWAALLKQPRVGARDNFFELGGHSLLAMQAVLRLRETLRVELPVRVFFEAPTVAELAVRLEALLGERPVFQAPPLVPIPREGELPLSFAQQRLWFMDRLSPDSPLYNIYMALRLDGALDVTVLEHCFTELVRRHESLRTTFRQGRDGAVQVIAPPTALPLTTVDLRAVPERTREEELRMLMAEEALRPFDLTRGPLLRVTLLRLGEAEHVLVLVMHHIVSDGWSMGVLVRELRALYEAFLAGKKSPLEALPIQYADYAKWQREWLPGAVLSSQLAWWRGQLEGAPPALELPTDRPRPAVKTYRGAVQRVHLPLKLAEGLRKLSQREGVTLFMTLLAGFHALLHRYSGQDDICVGSPTAGRDCRQVEGLIGFFVNMLVMRARVRGEAPFRELLRQVKETALGAYAHQEVPFEKLVEELKPARDTRRTPLFQVLFVLQNAPLEDLTLPGLKLQPLSVEGHTAKYELTLSLRETDTGLEGGVEFNTDLFDAETVARMMGHYARLLEGAVARPEQPVAALPLLTDEEQRRLLVEWNQTRTEYPRQASIHTLFEEQVMFRPEAVAAEYEARRLTYAELNRRANQVARTLRRLGVGEGTRVGLCSGRSLELVVAMLGILKAGGAYVPLDPSYPQDRLAFMLEDTAVPVVLVQPELASKLPPTKAKVVELSEETFAHERGENLEEPVGPESLAYVMYTSGSTGRPKGVCIPHRGVVRLVRDTLALQVTAEDRFTQMSNTSFDASNLELWGALLNGATVVGVPKEVALSPKALTSFLREKQVSVVVLTTALFNQVAAECPDAFRTVKHVLFGGEAADPKWVGEVLRWSGGVKLLNLYGPTENTTNTTWYEVKEVPEGATSVPIGRPVSNTEVYVLDERMQPMPVGLTGELYVGGDGLALGYLNRPELTAEKFVAHPFSTEPAARLYRTGDLVKYLPDGNLEFLGRRDDQVKVRGFRIELGEIEVALAKHPGVREAVVSVRDDGPSGRWLVAYVVPRKGEVETAALRSFLKESLPEHLVPSAIVTLKTLPLTPNGKVDRKALPAPDMQRTGRDYVAPESGLEQSLAAIWAEVLRLERVGAGDNFFDLGGNSLLLQAVHVKVEALMGREVPMVELFQFSTVRALAAHLSGAPGPVSVGDSSATGGNRREGMRRLAQHRRGRPGSN